MNRDPVVQALLTAADGYLLLLNDDREVVAANAALLDRLGVTDGSQIVGARPGELLGCHALRAAPGGCGTAAECATCGAALAVAACRRERAVATRESLMLLGPRGYEAAEFKVRCSPLRVAGHELTAMLMRDVSAEKRRDVLERVFLHDLMNTVGGLLGWGSLLEEGVVDAPEAASQMVRLAERIAAEVEAHRTLIRAESGDLVVTREAIPPGELLARVAQELDAPAAERRRALDMAPTDDDDHRVVETDPVLAGRVLRNMVKNAIEASPPGGRVRLWHDWRGDAVTFYVHNAGAIPDRVQLQLFRRSFSTKRGRGRGLGTYSMKLLGERYLGGRVDFTSDEAAGTVFRLTLPATPPG